MRNKAFVFLAILSASLLGACSIQEGSDSSSELFYPSAQMVFDKHAGHYPDGEQTRIPGKEGIVVSGGTYGQPFVVNGKEVATPGYVMSLYIADFNEDGYSELCLGCSSGSGWINESVFIYDYHNEKALFTLSDRKERDYFFGVLDEADGLFVFEYKVMTTEPLLRQGRIGYSSGGEIAVDWEEAPTSSQGSVPSSSSESSSVSTESSSSLPSGDVVRVEAAISPYRNVGIIDSVMASDGAYLANTFDAFAITVNAVFANGESVPIQGEGAVTFERNGYCYPYYDGALDGYIATLNKQGSFEMKISVGICVHEDDGNGQAKDVVKRFETSFSVRVDDSDPAWNALKRTARELYPWVNGLNEGSIEGIRYETGYIGVAPGSLRDIYYLESPQAISDALRITSATFAECSPLVSQMAGGWYYEYSYLIGGEKNTVRVNNGYVSVGGKSYKAQAYGAPSIWPEDEHRLGFVAYGKSQAHPIDGGDPVGLDGLGEIEFWAWPDDMGYVAEGALWRIDDFGEPLYVYEAKRFSYRGEMFQVLGDADFGALFA